MRRRFALWFVLPATALLLAVAAPLALGGRTLILRDVLNVHYEMKWVQGEAMRDGYLPLIDAARFGGQALLGNPNAAALYPDSLLLFFASPLWVLNAHFWIHLLLAPASAFWLGRAWGLGRRASWATGVCYVASGFFLSNLNLYNLVAAVTWAPALAAAALDLAAGRRPRRSFLALALLWTLVLLGGDPMTAAMIVVPAVAAPLVRDGWRCPRRAELAAALGLGTLVAAPQIVEFLRILPQSFRGHWRFSPEAATSASWNPVLSLEWLVPMAFGRPDLSFWGGRFFPGGSPLYFSLAPGVLAFGLVAASGRPRSRAAIWAWCSVAVGLFVALGRFNPVVSALMQSVGGGLLRLPIKVWPLVAVGGSLLCGIGFERLLRQRIDRVWTAAMAALAAFYAVLWLLLQLDAGPGVALLRGLLPEGSPQPLLEQVRLQWSGVALISLVVVALLVLLLRLARRRPGAAGVALALHMGVQLLLLRPLLPTDSAAFYRAPPPALAAIPAGAVVVQGDAAGLFGSAGASPRRFPDSRVVWLQRQTWEALYPYAAIRWGRRAEFAISPEGLDTFLARATAQALEGLPDPVRVRMLRVFGVEYLLLGRRLDEASEARVERVGTVAVTGGEHHLYRLGGSLGEAWMAGEVEWAPHLNAALARLTEPAFEPARTVVVAGAGAAMRGPPGRIEVLAAGPERLDLRTFSSAPGVVVTRRSFLPIYRVRVDGEAARPLVANLYKLAVAVPEGEHRVTIAVDRRPLVISSGVALLALAALVGLAARRRKIP